MERWLNARGIAWDYTINGGQAMLMVIVASAWKQVSYNFIFFLAVAMRPEDLGVFR